MTVKLNEYCWPLAIIGAAVCLLLMKYQILEINWPAFVVGAVCLAIKRARQKGRHDTQKKEEPRKENTCRSV
jgi:hypothetical protein